MVKNNDVSCDMLTSYLLGELSDKEVTLFHQHLNTCDRCRVELDDLMDINDKFLSASDDDMVTLPSDLKTRTLQKAFAARPPVNPQQRQPWWFNRSLVVAMTAATFVVGLVLGRMSTITKIPPQNQSAAVPAQMLNEINLVPIGDTLANGMAMVYRQNRNLHLVVYVRHMKPLSMYGCYSVWETVHGHRQNLGDFTVDGQGDAVISVSGTNLSSIEITLEPAWNDVLPKGPTVLISSSKQA